MKDKLGFTISAIILMWVLLAVYAKTQTFVGDEKSTVASRALQKAELWLPSTLGPTVAQVAMNERRFLDKKQGAGEAR